MSDEPIQTELEYEKFVDEIIGRIEGLFAQLGTNYEIGIQQTIKLLEWAAQTMKQAQTIADFRRLALTEMERPAPMRQKMLCGCLEHFPRLVAHAARYVAENEERGLPPLPRGRKGKTIQEKCEVVDFILSRIRKGYNTEQAKASAARRYDWSPATVQRIWDDRGNTAEPDYRSVLKGAVERLGAKPVLPEAGKPSIVGR
jgi:hypothetical protein